MRKLCLADIFVVADDYQFTTNHQINRTRIKTSEGPSWLTVPVLTKGSRGTAINRIRLNNRIDWREKHLRTLFVNYTYAAYFEQYDHDLNAIYRRRWDHLVDLNLALLDFIVAAIGIKTRIVLSSELDLTGCGNDKLRQMLQRLDCAVYLAGSEFHNHLRADDYSRNGFKVEFVDDVKIKYHQQFGAFINNLSFIDLLFNEGPDCVNLLQQSTGLLQ